MQTHNFLIANMDTDSISFSKEDGSAFTEEEQINLLEDLNSHYPEMIKWEHDGVYPSVVILKAKNYILYDGDKVKIKGSSLKSSKTKKGLKEFMGEIVNCLVFNNVESIIHVYHKYVREVFNVTDISRWTSKKTITEAVLHPTRTTEQKILNALNGRSAQMGDKFYMYFALGGTLKLQEDWTQDHDSEILLKKLYNTLVIFKKVIKIEDYPKYHLKRSKEVLSELLGKSI